MKSKDITLGGILVALTIIILYSTSIIPINTLTILTIASAITPVCIIRSNIKTATFVYLASSLIAFFIIPVNITIMYVLFFGSYGIVKYFAERTQKITLEYLIKLVFFNIVLIVGFVIMESVLNINIVDTLQIFISRFITNPSLNLARGILFFMAQLVFLILDYALTLIITFYLDRIHKSNV